MSDVANQTKTGLGQLIVDLGPVIVFVLTYNLVGRAEKPNLGPGETGDAIFWATGTYMIATAIALAYAKIKQDRVPPLLLGTAAIVIVFGALTLASKFLGSDELGVQFALIKPTIINWLMAAAIGGSVLLGHNLWKVALQSGFQLPDHVWNIFAWRWTGFFAFMGVLNLALAYAPENLAFWLRDSTIAADGFEKARQDFWANAKVALNIPLTLCFMALNFPLFAKYAADNDDAAPAGSPAPRQDADA